MINQVDFEGYLTRAWEYRERRFMEILRWHLEQHNPLLYSDPESNLSINGEK